MSGRRVTVVTAGHLATCPRMVKAADALHEAGYRVRVVSVRQTAWATPLDRTVHASRGWTWDVIVCDRGWAWLATGARFRAAQALARHAPRRPFGLAVRAFARTHGELVAAILHEPQDLIYGGTGGALAAVAEAARRSGTPYALDFEDLHCDEHEPTPAGALHNGLAAEIMRDSAREAAFVTAGSAAIALACADRLGVRATPISNTFPLPEPPSPTAHPGPLRLYWFSQTVGAGRGLEQVVEAAGLAGLDAELHLRGVSANGYVDGLTRLAARLAPALRVVHHAPAPPDAMVEACRAFDVGLAVEPFRNANSGLSLSNKALTYPLAGLALALTDTPGQRPLADALQGEVAVFSPADAGRLADVLARWASDPTALARAKEASWHAARQRWHWEHEDDRGALLTCVGGVFA